MKPTSELFEQEGRLNLPRTVKIVAEAIPLFGVETAVTFTSLGDGALRLYEILGESNIKIVATTFPSETIATENEHRVKLGIPDESVRAKLSDAGIVIVQAAMPFRGFDALSVTSMSSVVQRTLSIFGGGLSLCVQATLMACDAGHVRAGERCISFSGDTAIVVRAAHTHTFLSKKSLFAVEHILCKPLQYQVTRDEKSGDKLGPIEHTSAQMSSRLTSSEQAEQ